MAGLQRTAIRAGGGYLLSLILGWPKPSQLFQSAADASELKLATSNAKQRNLTQKRRGAERENIGESASITSTFTLCAFLRLCVSLLADHSLLDLSGGWAAWKGLILGRGHAAWQGLILGRRYAAGRRKWSPLLVWWRRHGRPVGLEIGD